MCTLSFRLTSCYLREAVCFTAIWRCGGSAPVWDDHKVLRRRGQMKSRTLTKRYARQMYHHNLHATVSTLPRLIVLSVQCRTRELCALPDDLLDSIQEISLSGYFSS